MKIGYTLKNYINNNNMKTKQLIVAGLIALCGSAFGTVTLNFTVNDANNFANASGVATDDMYWGIMIDAGGLGFSGSYAPASFTLATSTTYTFPGSDDVLVTGSFQTYTNSAPGTLFDVFVDIAGSVTAGDVFRVVWFDPTTNAIGTLADASFTLPADGSLTDYTAPFVGEDPVRSAGLAYSGTSGTSTGSSGFSIVPVPEPSAALLGAIGALGLLRRRRN